MNHYRPSTKDTNAARMLIPAELRNHDVPEGYWTPWAWMIEHEPETLLNMTDPVYGVIEEEAKARRIAIQLGEPVILIEAPEMIRKKGARLIGAYTKCVLLEMSRPE